jgi:hypothetical protein
VLSTAWSHPLSAGGCDPGPEDVALSEEASTIAPEGSGAVDGLGEDVAPTSMGARANTAGVGAEFEGRAAGAVGRWSPGLANTRSRQNTRGADSNREARLRHTTSRSMSSPARPVSGITTQPSSNSTMRIPDREESGFQHWSLRLCDHEPVRCRETENVLDRVDVQGMQRLRPARQRGVAWLSLREHLCNGPA